MFILSLSLLNILKKDLEFFIKLSIFNFGLFSSNKFFVIFLFKLFSKFSEFEFFITLPPLFLLFLLLSFSSKLINTVFPFIIFLESFGYIELLLELLFLNVFASDNFNFLLSVIKFKTFCLFI